MKLKLKGTTLLPSKGNLKIVSNKFNDICSEGVVLVEIPPCKRTIFFEGSSYFLSFPKILFFMRYIKTRSQRHHVRFVRMAFTKGRKLTLMVPPLTNIAHDDLEICLSKKCSGNTLEEMASNQIANIFSSQFNCDITDIFQECYEVKIEDDDFGLGGIKEYFEKWAKKTKNNPNWVPKNFQQFNNADGFYNWHDYNNE